MFQDEGTTIKRELEDDESNGVLEENEVALKKQRTEEVLIKEEEVEIDEDNCIEKSNENNAEDNCEANKNTGNSSERNLQNQNPLEDSFWVQDGLFFEEQDPITLTTNNFPSIAEKPTTSTGASTCQRNDKISYQATRNQELTKGESKYDKELLTYLQNDTDGKGILTIYEKNNSLTPSARRTLVHLLVQREKDEALKCAKPGEVLKDWENSQEETKVNPKGRKRFGRELDESFEFNFDEYGVKWGKCKLCLAQKPPINKTFKMTASNTTGIRRHLRKCHQTEFDETYPLVKNSKKILEQKLFEDRIVDWASKKYLPMNFFDDEGTRELFQHLNPTVEIPTENKMTTMVLDRFEKMQNNIKLILQSNNSKLSFSLDGSFKIRKKSFTKITCHFIDDNWELQSIFIDFVPKETAQSFHDTIEKFQISDQFLGLTLMNTNANFYFIRELENLMTFDSKSQHFPCYPNILNFSIQEMMKKLGFETNDDEDNFTNKDEEDDDDDDEVTNDDKVNIILSDIETTTHTSPLSKLRYLFKLLKSSKQWKTKLQKCCDNCGIKRLSTNIDLKMRWSATCAMINVASRMQQALILLCGNNNILLNKLILSDNEWNLMQEVNKYLRYFRVFSKTLDGKMYPTLNFFIVGFHTLIYKLEVSISYLKEKVRSKEEENVKTALETGIESLLKYYDKTNWVYCVVLILDPRYKLESFDATNWGKEIKASSFEVFKNIFKTQYFKAPQSTTLVDPLSVEIANQMECKIEDDEDLDIFVLYEGNGKTSTPPTNNDWQKELNLYLEEERANASVDILKWWRLYAEKYPNLSRMARDFLPISASSVPLEQCFPQNSLAVRNYRHRLTEKSFRCLIGVNSWINCSLAQKINSTL
ncbi:uncharacterized protein LOC122497809 isoform X1 [Leptopilina heterotoma]|uniref:uncharacterized protein LOC122497809 isoform X1 n=1 Tax=Leptopilina heterotoma TaxID=63436 RepID=UPI001CA8163A|nr:uncharacterized protein LOC122497809 isoform X1 [Leptopilina heterotoma]